MVSINRMIVENGYGGFFLSVSTFGIVDLFILLKSNLRRTLNHVRHKSLIQDQCVSHIVQCVMQMNLLHAGLSGYGVMCVAHGYGSDVNSFRFASCPNPMQIVSTKFALRPVPSDQCPTQMVVLGLMQINNSVLVSAVMEDEKIHTTSPFTSVRVINPET